MPSLCLEMMSCLSTIWNGSVTRLWKRTRECWMRRGQWSMRRVRRRRWPISMCMSLNENEIRILSNTTTQVECSVTEDSYETMMGVSERSWSIERLYLQRLESRWPESEKLRLRGNESWSLLERSWKKTQKKILLSLNIPLDLLCERRLIITQRRMKIPRMNLMSISSTIMIKRLINLLRDW